ncbi:SusC/RagA family TonB-linked outer membrane protein [Pedobacter sp. MW01-1-1]|uniref:SusC/RagA family TonB-linked outer membrane protein n=1 Tax=Pedobacter sp. MW01-1-1 TaxID=3383027 RepID=UPI003FEFF7CA
MHEFYVKISCAKWRYTTKFFKMMRLIFVVLLVSLMQVSAASFGQYVTLKERNISLEKVFKEIRKQAGYDVLLSTDKIRSTSTINANFTRASVDEVMGKVLFGKELTYTIEDKTIIIKPKPKSVLDKVIGYFVAVRVTGKVKDKDGKALPGVSVREKGGSNAVSTNESGDYAISVKEGATLVFSFIGYKSTEVLVSAKTVINITLMEDAAQLKEVNIVSNGFQTIDKKLYTGAAVTVSGSDVKQDGVIDVSRMLEGRVAGVSVQNVSGTFGAAPKIRVRGATSITGENKPLWVVDGIILEDVVNISNDQLSSGDPLTLIGSSVAGINADDIESFNILKDASATALYGARAMNGVVVITTKKGKVGKPIINYSGNFSTFLKPSYNSFNIMNSADQMSLYSEIYRKGGLSPNIVNGKTGGVFTKMYEEINNYDATSGKFSLENTPEARAAFLNKYAKVNTDWYDVLFKNSFVQEHSLSISSGSETARHYISLGYYNDNGWTLADQAKRYTMNFRGNYILSPKVNIGVLTAGSYRQQRAPGTLERRNNVVEGKYERDFDINPYSYALNTSRTMRPYDDNGNLEYYKNNYAPFNILEEIENNYMDLDMLDLKVQTEFNYKFAKNFEFKSIAGMRYLKSTTEHKITEYSNFARAYRYLPNSVIANSNNFLYDDPDKPEIIDPETVLPQGGFYNRKDNSLLNFNVRNQIDWRKTYGKHLINAFIGQEIKFTNRQNSFNNGYGYQYDRGGIPFTDYRIIKMQLEGNFNYYGMQQFYDRYAAFFFNTSYSYDSKYIFNGTFRYDGSNRLGKSVVARWLPTWTLSGAWNMDQEDFIKNISEISYLKLRTGYGLTASMGSASNSSPVFSNETTLRPRLSENESSIVLDDLENSELTWEKQHEANIGVDFGLFQSRIYGSFDYYDRRGFDLIGSFRTSGIGGEVSKYANYADMKSHGFEVNLGGALIRNSNFTWKTNFTFGYNKNKVTDLKSKPRIFDLVVPEGGAKEGGAVRGLYSIDFQKLDSNGTPTFIDENGEVSKNVYMQSTNTNYLKYEGSVDPLYSGGWNNTFTYKNFDLTVFVTYQGGNKIRLNNEFATSYSDSQANPKEFLDRWTLPGDENLTNVPSLADYLLQKELKGTYPYTAYNYSTDRVADGSFVRLKQISLGYNFSKKAAESMGLKFLSLKMQGNNIWLIYADKKLKGQDPEFVGAGGVAMPIPQQITFSLKVGI